MNEILKDKNCFRPCGRCNNLTCDSKLEEFNGICEDCFYGERNSKTETPNIEETKIITPNDLGKELNQDPRLVRRILRQRFEKQGRTWGWLEESEELTKVRNYIKKQLEEIEKEKLSAKKAKEKPAEVVSTVEA